MADRNQAKQRRQAQNRARRAEIAARAETSRRKGSDEEPTSGRGRPARTARGVASATGKGGRATTAAGRPVRTPVPRGGLLGKFGWNEPGGQAVILGAAATILASVALIFVKIIPTDGPWEVVDRAGNVGAGLSKQSLDQIVALHGKVHTETLLKNAGSRGWLFLALPVVLTWLTVLIARPSNRKRTWIMGAIAMFLFVMLYQQLGIFYIVPFGAFAWGTYQAYKVARLERLADAGGGRAIPTTARDATAAEDLDGEDYDDFDDEDHDADEDDDDGAPARRSAARSGGANARRPAAASSPNTGPRPGLLSSLFKPQPRATRSAGRPRRDRDE
ncbi:MAG TPA: hypothetical protein VHA73_06700 [Acidimicrobiales bacterium]|jgi:hypothetical protein|nr:hypothetical protein [Acidimicrobiales bacterium]